MTAGLVYERVNEMAKAEKRLRRGKSSGQERSEHPECLRGISVPHRQDRGGGKTIPAVATNPLYQTPEVALVNAGVCARGAGDLVDAERYFNQALAIRPNYAEAPAAIGQYRLRARRCRGGAGYRAALSGGE